MEKPKPESDKKEADNHCSDPEDEDLRELLDKSLQEFGKSVPPAAASSASADGSDSPTPYLDQKTAQKAAFEFQNMLRQLTEVQKVVLSQNQGGAEGEAQGSSTNNEDPLERGLDEAQFGESLLQNLKSLADKAQKVTEAQSGDEFAAAMQDLHCNEAYENEFLPFMQGLMGSLLSKDMMYPSLKEMCDKYPKWLEENGTKVSAEDKTRYEKQLSLMQEVCAEYEHETPEDTPEIQGLRFEKIMTVMQQMQMCGHPPEELIGSLPPGWSLDDQTGLPQVVDSQQAAEACVLM